MPKKIKMEFPPSDKKMKVVLEAASFSIVPASQCPCVVRGTVIEDHKIESLQAVKDDILPLDVYFSLHSELKAISHMLRNHP